MTAVACPPPAAERAHAVLSASSAHRWLHCPPSARLEETLPGTSSAFAEEGTLAHEIAATELAFRLGRITYVEYEARWLHYNGDVRVTPDFLAAVCLYVQLVKTKIDIARTVNPDAAIFLEERLDYSDIVPEGFGTGDVVIVCDGVLEVIDLKFGKGVRVSAENNPQCMLYGIGALRSTEYLYDVSTIRLTIIQPRLCEEPSEWEISPAELDEWGKRTVAPMAALAWKGDSEFNPGEHCRFCRARGSCRARAEAQLSWAQEEFKLPHLLTDEEIASVLDKADALKKWAGDVQAYALKNAVAGKKYVGWKLVRGRSNRKYADPDKVARRLIDAGIPEAVIYERSLLGITAMEKAITKKRFTDLLQGLVVQPPGALTLAPANDKRPEVEASALEGFDEIDSGETEE